MIARILSLLLVFNFIAVPLLVAQTKDGTKAEQTRQTAVKLSADSNNLTEVRMTSGEKFKGRINSVEKDTFSLSDAKSGKSQTIAFSNVDRIKKSGNGLSVGAWIAIGAAATAAIVVTVLLRERYCNEQAC